jgi:hypothetical protein
LLRVARRVVWFEQPERELADPVQFLAHVTVFGTAEDLKALRGILGKDEYREVSEHAPPGIFDVRSGVWWNLGYGRNPAPLLAAAKLVVRSNQMIHSRRVRPRQDAVSRGSAVNSAVNHVFDPEH